MRVLAVVVTYNRRHLLSRCIDHLLQQIQFPDSLLVVNNASTDGTVELLQERGVSFVTQENVGSAGGWHRGIQHATDNGFDAVWLMDDDGYPDSSALASLKKALVPGVSCASSVVVREDAPDLFVFPYPVLGRTGLPIIIGFPRKIPSVTELKKRALMGTYPYAQFFNGALISIDSVRKIGNVDRDFFIFGDEVDYFYRLRNAGQVISVLDALHFHPDVSKRPYTPAKVYYYLKNTLILNARYFNAVWLRHAMAVAAVLGRTAKRNGIGMVLSLLVGPGASMFYLAISRGLRGKVGKDFLG